MEVTKEQQQLLFDIYTSHKKEERLYANEETTYQLNDIGLRNLELGGYVEILGREENLLNDRQEDLRIIVTDKGKELLKKMAE